MATISKTEALEALSRLGELASGSGDTIELMLLGGGAMVIAFDARELTRDLDVVVLSPQDRSAVRALARQVALERSWPEDWLNDAAKGFVVGYSDGGVLLSTIGITVRRPSTEQLLAMKLCAWRDDVDIADARRLLKEFTEGHDSVWSRIQPYLQPGRELVAKYAFEDLCEETHGTA
jgi:hypothetical protein